MNGNIKIGIINNIIKNLNSDVTVVTFLGMNFEKWNIVQIGKRKSNHIMIYQIPGIMYIKKIEAIVIRIILLLLKLSNKPFILILS